MQELIAVGHAKALFTPGANTREIVKWIEEVMKEKV
jgi:hypothetical protein